MGESRTGHIPMNENPADLVTKIIMSHPKRAYLIGKLLYDIYKMEQELCPWLPWKMHSQVLQFPCSTGAKYNHIYMTFGQYEPSERPIKET